MLSHRKLKKLLWLYVCCLVFLPLFFPKHVIAHPLDEFYQATFITLAPRRVNLTIELYTGVLVAPKVIELIDTDDDALISQAEAQSYIERFITDVTLEVDDQPLDLQMADYEFPTVLDLQAGVGVIRLQLYADVHVDAQTHMLFYENNHFSDVSTYLVNALSDNPEWVEISQQEKDVFQKSARLEYVVSNEAPIDIEQDSASFTGDVAGGVTEGQKQLAGFLYNSELSPFLIVVSLGLSVVLGGLHALTPGHGKTLVAAYLIGSRGTIRHAMVLGGIVTFTHTASVIVIGLLALLASQFIVPNVLVPLLEIISGLLVVWIGFQLLWGRWIEYRRGSHQEHDHHHHHNEDDHAYAHKHGLPHHHHPQETVTFGSLLTLGISGGLIPCPEALGVMLIAIGLNRILLGLGLVVAFSFGLAAVLIIIGVLLVKAKSILARFESSNTRWQTLLPLISAVIVTLLGIGIFVKGVLAYI